MPLCKQSIGVLMVSLLLTGAVWAQVSRGSITGIVTDPTGAVVPGVAITITNVETGVTNKVKTNESGMYTVPLLEGANYRLSAEKAGFKRYEQTGILVQSGSTARVDFSLSIGLPTQSVLVTGEPSLLERETSDTQTIVTSREMEDLPLTSLGEQRNPAAFMQLAPGVTGRGSAAPMNGDFANYTRTMTPEVSGSMVGSTSFMLDGADVTSGGGFEGDLRSFQVPPDAVGELKLMATNSSAEFGRSAGGAASFQIKSGSNQIHGTAFEFLRNDVLDARYFFQPSVSPYRQN